MNSLGRFLDLLLPAGRPESARAIAPDPAAAAPVDLDTWQPDPPAAYCPRCGAACPRAAVTERGCPRCVDRRLAWDQVWRLSAYHPPVSHWIVRMKFHRQWRLAAPIADRLARILPDITGSIVTPVPMHWRRRLGRGYNVPHLIARRVAQRKGVHCRMLLRRIRLAPPQSRLHTLAERRANVRASFAPRPIDLRGKTVYLVDDVKTTGITAGHCARLLRRMGAERVHLALIAVADPRQSP